ncbi:MAG: hypothetical protein IPF57_03620 [Gammaproteobacteria bacterium]|nr:hypothetical protein [Gammaproteobacteria bacterium]
MGSVLLDTRCEVMFANDMARRLLDGSHGLSVVQHRLVASTRVTTPRCSSASRRPEGDPAETPTLVEAMSVGGFAREQRLSLLIRPVSGVEEALTGQTPAVAVFLRDTQARRRPRPN